MFVSWTLENFKSVGRELTLSLSPITIFVGANSSGKSSIIQSILLIKQTLQYATSDQPIALNGPLIKLGNYNDVKNVLSKSEGFRIGWKFDAGNLSAIFPHLDSKRGSRSSRLAPYRSEVSEIECATQFGVDPNEPQNELSLLQPRLLSCKMHAAHANPDDEHPATLRVSRANEAVGAATTFETRSATYAARHTDNQRYLIDEIDFETRAAALEDHPNGEIIGAAIRHFFPFYIAVRFDTARRRATQIADAICTLRKPIRFQREYADLPAPPPLRALIDEWLTSSAEIFPDQKMLFSTHESIGSIGDIVETLLRLRQQFRWRRGGAASFPSLQELQPRIVEALVETFVSELDVEFERPRLLSDAILQTRDYFQSYVRYLGLLRDEPKPLYPLEALGDPTDVGYHGEHTAAVLHLNQLRDITYVPSTHFKDSPTEPTIDTSLRNVPLRSAVVDWLSYMGVVEEVLTGDRGKIGHELQVQTPGIKKFHDLTNVGVGVSQVLPIVLMALLAEPGSLLIFEQPELHLHPRVQTRLADFFISIALSGKQCLLETHSEYLVHRLRRRVAEASGEQLTKLSKLYFVEREGGLTSCRSVDITQYGAILDWPAEFFDQAQVESERILVAASAKRSTERRSKRTTLR
jgi:predicted ATPase